MTFTPSRLAVIALLCATVATPCAAESFASSASSAGSASSGSVSDSIGGSSKSSTGEAKVADGDYRVIEVADVSDRPGLLRLTLQATAPQGEAGEVLLTLPRRRWRSAASQPAPSSARASVPTAWSSRMPIRARPSSWCSPTTGTTNSLRAR
jgi:hypothetical protein